jgi:hypothetical protein
VRQFVLSSILDPESRMLYNASVEREVNENERNKNGVSPLWLNDLLATITQFRRVI